MTFAKSKSRLLPIFAIAIISMLAGHTYAAGTLPISPLSWIPVAALAVLVVMAVAGIVWALSGTIGSANARTWSRAQIYEALLSLLMLVAFGAFAYLFFTNPQPAFSALGLVPTAVPPGLGFGGIDCTKAASVFELGSCDLALFNLALFQMQNIWYMATYITGILPGFSLTVNPLGVPDLGFKFELTNLVPFSFVDLLTFTFTSFLTMMLLQQIQLMVLSSSILLLSLFLTLGLVARTFGFTRTFGGAMIAFGLGLGLVYPLLTAVTYGYIDTHAQLSCIFPTTFITSGNCALVATALSPASVVAIIFSLIFQSATNINIPVLPGVTLPTGAVGFALSSLTSVFVAEVGYFLAGITFIPFLNFIVVDAFIIDFSSAIGERMDFMSLLTKII